MIYEVRDATGVAVAWTTSRIIAADLAERMGGDYIRVSDRIDA